MCPLIWLRVNLPGLHKGLPASFAQLRSLYQRPLPPLHISIALLIHSLLVRRSLRV